MSGKRKPNFIKKREETQNKERHENERTQDIAALNEIKQAYINTHKDDSRRESWKAFREYHAASLFIETMPSGQGRKSLTGFTAVRHY